MLHLFHSSFTIDERKNPLLLRAHTQSARTIAERGRSVDNCVMMGSGPRALAPELPTTHRLRIWNAHPAAKADDGGECGVFTGLLSEMRLSCVHMVHRRGEFSSSFLVLASTANEERDDLVPDGLGIVFGRRRRGIALDRGRRNGGGRLRGPTLGSDQGRRSGRLGSRDLKPVC